MVEYDAELDDHYRPFHQLSVSGVRSLEAFVVGEQDMRRWMHSNFQQPWSQRAARHHGKDTVQL